MPTTIKLRNSVTTTSAPSSLVQGEVAINITDKKVWVGNAATTPIQLLGDGGSASFTSIAFGAGTVSNPSITFTGDTNTGIYSPAADTIAFTEGGVEAMRITAAGDVGIGGIPSFRLDVRAAQGIVSNTSTTGTNPVDYRVSNTGGNTYFGRDNSAGNAFGAGAYSTVIWSEGAYPMVLATNGSERMRIDSSGNLLVGKTITGDTTEGNIIAPTYVFFTRNGFAPLNLRRLTSSGSIAEFYSGTSGTSAGAISVASTGMTYTGTNGITFTATQTASADANTLDDYEEGTWTPTDASGAGLTFTGAEGRYTKVGNVVFFSFNVTYPVTANTNNAGISGFPFAAGTGLSNPGSGFITYVNTGVAYTIPIGGGSTTGNFYNLGGGQITNATISGSIMRYSGVIYT